MSKALFGTHALPSEVRLLDEVQRLRARVAELEEALAAAQAAAQPEAQAAAQAEAQAEAQAAAGSPATGRSDVDPVHAPAGY